MSVVGIGSHRNHLKISTLPTGHSEDGGEKTKEHTVANISILIIKAENISVNINNLLGETRKYRKKGGHLSQNDFLIIGLTGHGPYFLRPF